LNQPHARFAHYASGASITQQDKNTARVFSEVSGQWKVGPEFWMDSAAVAEIKHLIYSGREMKAMDEDARDEWNGAKKVMNCSEKKQLLLEPGGHNLDPAELFPLLFWISDPPVMAEEILMQLRLLHSTIQVKLSRFA
jgi:hypothetical protein